MEKFSPEEDKIMEKHFQYLKNLQKKKGKVFLAGPVVDQGPPFGIYVFNVKTREKAVSILENDPSVKAGVQEIMEVREVRLSLNPLQDEYPITS